VENNMSTILHPLVSPEVDLRDFGFMPLDVLRLRDSDMAVLSNGDEFKAAVMLWCVAWHQVPAASLPKDDRLLAHYSGALGGWRKVREGALRGFVECSDGRLYHPVIAEKALESWAAKQAQRERTRKATEERERRRREADAQRDVQRNVPRDGQRNVERDVHQGTGTGTVKGQGHSVIAPAAKPRPAKRCPDGFEVTPDMRASILAELPALDVDRETAKFRDHTFATARSDWPATWRNWMRTAGERLVPMPRNGTASHHETAWQRSQRERVAEMTGGTVSRKPPPGAPGYQPEFVDVEPVAPAIAR
jgi:hypothetical protein